MFYDVKKGHGLSHDLFKAIVSPRPIGWVTTMILNGEINLSPYSFFNITAERPHLVAFSSLGVNDAMTFAEQGGDFVCNLATFHLRHQVNETSSPFTRGINEMEAVGLAATPSHLVRPPRVAESPAALEGKWVETIRLKDAGGEAAGFFLVIGEVVGVHIDDQFLTDGVLDTAAMRPILRGGYFDYFVINDNSKFSMPRPEGGGRS